MQYAASAQKQNIGILYPDNTFGRSAEAAAQAIAPQLGINIASSLSYSASAGRDGAASRQTAAEQMGEIREEIDGVFIPDGGGRLREVASLAFFYQLDPSSEAYLGTTLMDDASLTTEPALNGAHFSALEGTLSLFESRFATSFGSTPRSSSLAAYDAMSMVARLHGSGQSLGSGSLTNPDGFSGVMGTYRLNADGTTERLLGIKKITPNGIQIIQAAGASFLF